MCFGVMKMIFKQIDILAGCALLFTSLAASAQSGVLVTKRSAPFGVVTFTDASTLTGISNTKHIDGYVKKNGSSNFIFPVGDNNIYRPFAAAADGTTGAYFLEDPGSTTIPEAGPFSTTEKDSKITAIDSKEFWDIDGQNETKISLTWNAASGVAQLTGSTIDLLTIVGWSKTSLRWEKISSGIDQTSILGGASNLTAGSITSTAAVIPDNYSIFTLASASSSPLPVTLIGLRASINEGSTVNLDWKTTSEQNSQQFDIQHSIDGKIWNFKGSVDARGESSSTVSYTFTDDKPVSGENLYRLKMIDRDGTFAYSKIEGIRVVNFSAVFYPNPTSDRLFVNIPDLADVIAVSLKSSSGISVYSATTIPASGIDVKNLDTGIYVIQIFMRDGTCKTHKILVAK